MQAIKRETRCMADYITVNSVNSKYKIMLHMHDSFNLNIAMGEISLKMKLNVVIEKASKVSVVKAKETFFRNTATTIKVECYRNGLEHVFIPMYKPLIFKDGLEVIY